MTTQASTPLPTTRPMTTRPMTTRSFLWQLLRYKPWAWLLTVLAYMTLYGLNFAPPLIVRTLFDQLTGAAPVGFGLWPLVALYVATAVGRQAAYVALTAGQLLYFNLIDGVVRANLLEQLLHQPEPQATPTSTGKRSAIFAMMSTPSTNSLAAFLTWSASASLCCWPWGRWCGSICC